MKDLETALAAGTLTLIVVPMPVEEADRYRAGAPDAYGRPPERAVSDGTANPCRCCLTDIPGGRDMLILAHRPFERLDPYAETGPIFLCADACAPHRADALPEVLAKRKSVLVKGYLANDRIHYGTGRIVAPEALEAACRELLEDGRNAYLHVRSATNNCYQFRVDRG